jgi:histone H1/5
MSDDDQRPSEVLGALPRTRPHRRSDKRGKRPGQGGPAAAVTSEALDAVQAAVATGDPAPAQAPAVQPKSPAARKPAKPPAKAKGAAAPRAKAAAGAARAKASASAGATAAAPTRAKAAAGPARAKAPTPAAAKGSSAARAKLAAPPAESAPPAAKPRKRPGRSDVLGTAVQAAGELAEIGLSASARALRRAVSRLPRP